MNCVNAIPCSIAECELRFSAMNLIITDIRSSLLVSNVSSLMLYCIWAAIGYVEAKQLCSDLAAETQIEPLMIIAYEYV